MSDASDSSGGLERLNEAAERARRELLQQLAMEADRLDRDLDTHSERISADLSLALDRRLREASERDRKLLSRQLESGATALRAEIDAILGEARSELDGLHRELARLGGEIRTAATRAEHGIIETARVAEATVSARAQSAAAEAIRDLTSTAAGLAERLEQRSRSADSRDRLDAVLNRIQAADRRLRDSDARTRRALGRLSVLD